MPDPTARRVRIASRRALIDLAPPRPDDRWFRAAFCKGEMSISRRHAGARRDAEVCATSAAFCVVDRLAAWAQGAGDEQFSQSAS